MKKAIIFLLILTLLWTVFQGVNRWNEAELDIREKMINEDGDSLEKRFNPPDGFTRVSLAEGSFGKYLRALQLKPPGSRVEYFDGRIKMRQVQEAVIDIDVGNRDLQQCADAVMRLRAEYLYELKKYEQINFHFTNGFQAQYRKWMEGYRIDVQGNRVSWVKDGVASADYASFRKYLDMVFAYAGTLSLSRELESVDLTEMIVGDVFIQGGSPGHCVIIVDMAENKVTGEKLFMLAQSYMPAQDIHVLKNPGDQRLSPWYRLNFEYELVTPEWNFTKNDLKRFP